VERGIYVRRYFTISSNMHWIIWNTDIFYKNLARVDTHDGWIFITILNTKVIKLISIIITVLMYYFSKKRKKGKKETELKRYRKISFPLDVKCDVRLEGTERTAHVMNAKKDVRGTKVSLTFTRSTWIRPLSFFCSLMGPMGPHPERVSRCLSRNSTSVASADIR